MDVVYSLCRAFNALLRLCGASSDPTTTTGVLNGMAACGIVPDQV